MMQILKPLESSLGTGTQKRGKILVVAPQWLRRFSFGSLPENKKGLVQLGKHFSFYTHSTMSSMAQTNCVISGCFEPNFFGVAVPATPDDVEAEENVNLSDAELKAMFRKNLKTPPDLENAKLRFETKNKVLVGDQVSKEVWQQWIRGARYVYLSEFDAGPNGRALFCL